MRGLAIGLAFGVLGLIPAVSSAQGPEGPYHFVKEIKVGGEGGWDYLSADAASRRLYVTHATKVVVIDLDTLAVVGEVADTPGVHGFVAVPDLGRGFSSNGRESKVSVVDLKTLATLSKVDTGENPDAILYEPGRKEVYAFNGRGRSATVFEAQTGKVVATIPLDAKPESGAADPAAKRVYVNLEDKNTVAAIDTTTHQVVATWPIAPGESATGMAFDLARKRLIIGAGNKLMVMMDSGTGKVVGTVPIGARVDATAYDPETRLAFSSNGEGTVTVARVEGPDKLTVVQNLPTTRGARTMTLDTKTHNIFLAAVDYQSPAPAADASPGAAPTPGATGASGATGAPAAPPRPVAVPGSFKVLVYGMSEAPKK
jgi:hypothetical protein